MAKLRDRKTLRDAAALLERQASELALRMPVSARGAAQVSTEDKGQHDQCLDFARRLRVMARR